MINKTSIEMINKLVWVLDPGWSAQAMGPFAVIDNNYRLSNQEYLEYIAENISSDFTSLQNQLFKINSYYRRICCYCIFNSNPKFIEIIKDTENTYKDSNVITRSISETYRKQYRSWLNEYINYINDKSNKEFIISYLNKWGYLDSYLNALNDIEKLCYIMCAMVAEVDALDTKYFKTYGRLS